MGVAARNGTVTLSGFTLHNSIPEAVLAVVHTGHVTLTGKVDWLFQKESAERAVRYIRGVRGVFNYITVTMSGDTARLTGTVGTWQQRESADEYQSRGTRRTRSGMRLATRAK